MQDILIFPFGGNAQESLLVVLAINVDQPVFNVVGFIDDNEKQWGKEFCGIKVLGGRTILDDYPDALLLAVPGNPDTFGKRYDIIAKFNLPVDRFATIIDPSARLSPDARIGQNTVIMAHTVISCSVTIGKHCVILPNTVIAHNSRIDEYCMIGANVTVSGSCSIGQASYIGSGSSIKDHINIGPNSHVGIGSNVIRDVPACSVVAGNPARFLRSTNDS